MPSLLNRRVLSQAFIALLFDLLGIVSGRIALFFSPLFQSALWVLALYPPILSVRGNVGGIFSGNLSTMLHIGDAEPRIRGNTRAFYSLIKSTFILIFVDTIVIGIIAYTMNYFLGNTSIGDMVFFMVVPPLTCLLAMVMALPLATFIGIVAFKRGLDPDILLYPAVSTIDDVVVTICYVIVVYLAVSPSILTAMTMAMVVLGVFFFVMLMRNRSDRFFKRVLREGGPMIIFSSLLATLGGIGLASLRGKIEENPSILILYPALIDTLGDIGSVIGSMETTRLALGESAHFLGTLRGMLTDLISVEAAAASMHVVFGFLTFTLGLTAGFVPDLTLLIKIALIANLVSFLFISIFSLLIATQTFKYGLDPDNFVIPLVTSVSDFGATFALIITLTILGV